MINTIKKHKQDIIIFVIIFILSLIMCSAFLQPHYPHDTYKIINDGLAEHSFIRFLQDGRPFSAISTTIVDMMNMPIEVYMILSLILALFFMSLSVVTVYKMLRKHLKTENKLLYVMLLLISFIFIYNYLAIEFVYFLESFILAIGIYLSILAAKFIIDNEKYKYVKAMLVLIVAAFCYQGSIAIFPMLIMTHYLLLDRNNLKESIKNIVIAAIIYGVAMLSTIIFCNVFFYTTRIQVANADLTLQGIFEALYILIVKSFNIIPPYIHIGIMFITIIFILMNKKDRIKLTLSYLFIILGAICICLMPIITGSGLGIETRFCISYGTTVGISLLFMLYTTQEKNKYIKFLIYTIIVAVFIMNFITYLSITYQHLEVNKLDKQICQIIDDEIEKYEQETGIKVTKVAAMLRNVEDVYYPGFWHVGDMTESALKSWAVKDVIIYYLDKDMEYAPITYSQYKEWFENKEWNGFSKEQIVIEGDTIYFCGN